MKAAIGVSQKIAYADDTDTTIVYTLKIGTDNVR